MKEKPMTKNQLKNNINNKSSIKNNNHCKLN
jgi:hypothetical protein